MRRLEKIWAPILFVVCGCTLVLSATYGDEAKPPPAALSQFATGAIQFQVDGQNVRAIATDEDSVWIGTSAGLIHYMPRVDRFRKYDNRSGLLSNGVFSLDRINGEIWVGTYGGGLSILSPATDTWRHYNIPNGMGDAFVYDVLKTRKGDIWIATWSGVNQVLNGDLDRVENWLLYTVENTDGGLPNDWVYGLAEGPNGEIWLATEGGLARFADSRWDNWQHADGLGADYEAVKAHQPFKNDPGEYSGHHARQKVEQGLENIEVAYNPNYVVALHVDNLGRVWAGTWGGGLGIFDDGSWHTLTVVDGLPGNHVFAINKGSNGEVWIGTSRGLGRFEDDRIVRYGHGQGLYSETIFSIASGADGGLWVGGLGGVTWFPKGL